MSEESHELYLIQGDDEYILGYADPHNLITKRVFSSEAEKKAFLSGIEFANGYQAVVFGDSKEEVMEYLKDLKENEDEDMDIKSDNWYIEAEDGTVHGPFDRNTAECMADQINGRLFQLG